MNFRLAVAILAFGVLQGCGAAPDTKSTSSSPATPVPPRWEGYDFRIAFRSPMTETKGAVTPLPAINYTANPSAVPASVRLLARYGVSDAAAKATQMNVVRSNPIAITQASGELSVKTMEVALVLFLGSESASGKGTLFFAVAKAELGDSADARVIEKNRLSEWLPLNVLVEDFKISAVR